MIGFLIGAAIYVGVCEFICNILDVNSNNARFWVYAIVSSVGGFLLNAMMH